MNHKTILPCTVCDGFVSLDDAGEWRCDKHGIETVCHTTFRLLSETRKPDREKMLKYMIRLCERLGVPHEVDRAFLGNKDAVAIGIRGPTGLAATIDFDRHSCQPNTYVISWHMLTDSRFSGVIIRPDFAQDRNEYHKRKATDVCRGFDQLVTLMSHRLQRIADGTATENKPEPAATGSK